MGGVLIKESNRSIKKNVKLILKTQETEARGVRKQPNIKFNIPSASKLIKNNNKWGFQLEKKLIISKN